MEAVKCSNSMADSTIKINLKKKSLDSAVPCRGHRCTKIPHIMQYSHKLQKQSRDPYRISPPFQMQML